MAGTLTSTEQARATITVAARIPDSTCTAMLPALLPATTRPSAGSAADSVAGLRTPGPVAAGTALAGAPPRVERPRRHRAARPVEQPA